MLIEILKITIPALLVFLAGYMALSRLLREDANRRKFEQSLRNQRITTPIRLQAYERIILFLERISPDSLLVRVSQPNMSAQKLQATLLATIRSEWEHNLSQQLYISPKAWDIVKNSKDNLIKLINTASAKVPPQASALHLSQIILEMLMEMEDSPTTKGIDFLKKEVTELF